MRTLILGVVVSVLSIALFTGAAFAATPPFKEGVGVINLRLINESNSMYYIKGLRMKDSNTEIGGNQGPNYFIGATSLMPIGSAGNILSRFQLLPKNGGAGGCYFTVVYQGDYQPRSSAKVGATPVETDALAVISIALNKGNCEVHQPDNSHVVNITIKQPS